VSTAHILSDWLGYVKNIILTEVIEKVVGAQLIAVAGVGPVGRNQLRPTI